MSPATKIQIHRVGDLCAIAFGPFGPEKPTEYMTREMLGDLIQALLSCHNDLAFPPACSRFPTTTIEA